MIFSNQTSYVWDVCLKRPKINGKEAEVGPFF